MIAKPLSGNIKIPNQPRESQEELLLSKDKKQDTFFESNANYL